MRSRCDIARSILSFHRFTGFPVRWFGLIFLFLFSLNGRAVSQDSLTVRYSSGLKTESWQGGYLFQQRFSATQLFVSENLASSRLRVTPETDKWKDEHKLVIQLSRNILKGLTAGLAGEHSSFIDKQSGFQNDIRTSSIRMTGEFTKFPFHVPFTLGVKKDRRFNQTDQGLTYRFGVDMPNFDLGPYQNMFMASFEEDHLHPRKNSTFSAYYDIHRQFYTETTDSLRLSLSHQRRDYYISASGEIESRDDRIRSVENVLTYRVASGLICHLRGSIHSRYLQIGQMN